MERCVAVAAGVQQKSEQSIDGLSTLLLLKACVEYLLQRREYDMSEPATRVFLQAAPTVVHPNCP